MTLATPVRTAPLPPAPRRAPVAGVAAGLVVLVLALALLDLVQGTAALGPRELWAAVTGTSGGGDEAVVLASRLPRAGAAILVGLALGAAGAVLQTMTRNALASPDTLAVNAGAALALALVAATGLTPPLLASSGVALVGGLLAAGLVLALTGPGASGVRLVLAGTALALGLAAITDALVLLFPQETTGIYQWNRGSVSQSGADGVLQTAPLMAIGLAGLLLVGRRLDALGLGDDAALGIGVRVRRTRFVVVGCAVLLSAAAVTLTGPIGFIGLCAPALVRLIGRRVRGATRTRALVPLAGLVGAALVLASDVGLRAVVGAQQSVAVPTGVVTTLLGAVFLVVLAQRARSSATSAPTHQDHPVSRTRFLATAAALGVLLAAVVVAALLLGDSKLLLGDLANWAQGRAGRVTSYVLDTRLPRVAAAALAGAALALAGALVQAVTRNPLAEPGILGVAGGAGLGAVLVVTAAPLAGAWAISGAAFAGAGAVAVVVFGLAARGGFRHDRLVLVGVGASAATTALISLVIVLTDPFSATKALTWLSGSTYGRTAPDVVPVAVALLAGAVLVLARHRELDLLSLDEDTPRLLGVRQGPARLLLLSAAVVLTAAAVAAVGVVGFVGLVAPHAARALVGRRHRRAVPVAVLLGALLVCAADALGRTVIAPGQLGAGLLTAVLGVPYFVWLLHRSRT